MNYSRYTYTKTLIGIVMDAIEDVALCSSRMLRQQFFTKVLSRISHERNQIYDFAQAGEWGMTVGDSIFIKYLDEFEVVIKSCLGATLFLKKKRDKIRKKLNRLQERLEANHNPKIKIVFLAQEASIWTSFESVYTAFFEDQRCDVQLVYLPFAFHESSEKRDWLRIYKEMGVPMRAHTDYDLSDESPDIVFFAKPYDGIPMQFYIDNVDTIVRRCIYIPYWVNWMAVENIQFLIDYHYRLSLFEKAWKVFDAPDYVRESHYEYGPKKGENLELIGHPRFDAIAKLDEIREAIPDTWKDKIAGKKVVAWNTHSYLAAEEKENWSTFSSFGWDILTYFQNNQEVALLWRPHPHFFGSLRDSGIMTDEEVDELIEHVSDQPNIILDRTPSYLYAFSVADALISDASSLLVEFFPTLKPILYTYTETSYSIVNENLLLAIYQAKNWDGVEQFIQMLVDGTHNKEDVQRDVVESFMPNFGKDVGKLIVNKCIKDLIAEEVASVKSLFNK